jgi:hypothetical protein
LSITEKLAVLKIDRADATQFDYPQEPFVVYASTMERTLGAASEIIEETSLFEQVRSNKMPLLFDVVRFAVFKARNQESSSTGNT